MHVIETSFNREVKLKADMTSADSEVGQGRRIE